MFMTLLINHYSNCKMIYGIEKHKVEGENKNSRLIF